MIRQETWTYNTWFGKCSILMHTTFQLYDVLGLDSTVLIYVLISISFPKLNNQII